MANGDVQNNIADSYLQKFDQSLSISGMQKLRKFPMLQELGYNGQLNHIKENFHGLREFNVHMGMYSAVHWIVTLAWQVIKNIVPKNPFIEAFLFTSDSMGKVGILFKSVHNFDKVFAINTDKILDPSVVASKISGI